MGKVLRGRGTTQEWTVAKRLHQSRWYTLYTVKHPNHNTLTKEQRDKIATMPTALPKTVLLNALMGSRRMHGGGTVDERKEWVMSHSRGLGLQKDGTYNSIHSFMLTLERLLDIWPIFKRLAMSNPEGAQIFSRRQSPHMDSHVGIHVGGMGGMPKNMYSSVNILPTMRDADLTYLRQLHAKLKPLTDLLLQTFNAAQQTSTHNYNIRELDSYAEELKKLDEVRDEWVRQDTEVIKWLESRPDCIKDGRLNIRTSSQSLRDSTFYQLLGRRSWESTQALTVRQYGVYAARVEEYTHDITSEMIDREAVKKGITAVMKEAVHWACTYEADFTPTDGGEEE